MNIWFIAICLVSLKKCRVTSCLIYNHWNSITPKSHTYIHTNKEKHRHAHRGSILLPETSALLDFVGEILHQCPAVWGLDFCCFVLSLNKLLYTQLSCWLFAMPYRTFADIVMSYFSPNIPTSAPQWNNLSKISSRTKTGDVKQNNMLTLRWWKTCYIPKKLLLYGSYRMGYLMECRNTKVIYIMVTMIVLYLDITWSNSPGRIKSFLMAYIVILRSWSRYAYTIYHDER